MPEKPQEKEKHQEERLDVERERREPASEEPKGDYYYDDAHGYEPYVDGEEEEEDD